MAVLSYGFWRDLTGGDRRSIGSTMRLDGESFELIGVLPPDFGFPRTVQLWTPHPIDPGTRIGHVHLKVADLERALAFIRRVNSLFGYTRSIVRHLERFSRGWKKGQRIDIVDLATGSADIPRAILKWAAPVRFAGCS